MKRNSEDFSCDRNCPSFVAALRALAQSRPDQVAYYFFDDREQDEQITYGQLDRRARAIAAQLTELDLRGHRALLLYPPGLDFVAGFFGCLYAGTIAVPAFPPRRNRKMARIEGIHEDAQASIALSVQDVADRSMAMLAESQQLADCRWLATDRVAPELGDDWLPAEFQSGELAAIQYTSGSTGTPRGVMLTHGNLVHNCAVVTEGFVPDENTVGLTWMPTYHDMGLVGGVLAPMFFRRPNALMSPMAFLQKPARWLQGISRFGADFSGGPNFAYALCVDKVTDQQCEGLDLSSWRVAFNGAEPVRAATLEAFTEKFAKYGFRAEAHYPCYGMAESTLIATGSEMKEPPVVRAFDATALESHRALLAKHDAAGARRLVSSGRTLLDDQIAIVDPETCEPLTERRVGEIWISSRSVALGYWNRPSQSQQRFRAKMKGDDTTEYLRSGDLGFLDRGELFVTGRLKDVIIVRGRNVYPQDLEATVDEAHPVLRRGGGATFCIDLDGEEQLVVAHEVDRGGRNADTDEVLTAIRQRLLEEHEVLPHAVLLLKTGSLPKTSSGKVQRGASRQAFLRGALQTVASWSATDGALPVRESNGQPSNDYSTSGVSAWLVDRIARQLNVAASDIDIYEPFSRFGLDSVAVVGISGDLEDWLGQHVSPTVLYSYPTIASLAQHLAPADQQAERQATIRSDVEPAEPLAIVGMSCRFPGANDPEQFWQLLRNGGDAVGDVPTDRWDADTYYDPNPDATGKMITRRGGFLDEVDQFDPQFFELSPREAETLDPQQRLLLEVSWEALEDAGQAPDRLVGSDVGIFVGIANCDYGRLQDRTLGRGGIDAHTGTGTLSSVAAGRVAYFLGLRGPTMAIDTACSSSLVALHLAAESIRKGECRAALAGGVNLILDPNSSIALSAARALSPTGLCKTFDENADGYVRGEGCGMVVVKRLSDALQDRDRILGVLRGSAVNHDGHSNGLTAPHGPSQVALIQRALAHSGVDAGQVTYIEAHGTGTSLGDPIEVQALSEVIGDAPANEPPVAIGSVKTNIGHLEAAAGVAGLIKVVLSLQHREIPAHLHLEKPNPFIPWEQLPLTVPTRRIAWTPRRGRRIAGVSSFGFSGTNAHVVVEEPPIEAPQDQQELRPQHVLVLSAKSEAALNELAGQYGEYLVHTQHDFASVCFTAAAGRSHFEHRLAVVADNPEQCRRRLDSATPAVAPRGEHPKIAFLFTGQGSQYVGMARTLYHTQPTFRRALQECDAILRESLPRPLLSVMYDDQHAGLLNQTGYTQPALFAVQYALCELWKSWGIEPTAVLGHSVGEFAAACTAGVFSLEDGLNLIATRGRIMQELPSGGAMFAVSANEQRVRRAMAGHEKEVAIAAINGPAQTVLSGAAAAVQTIIDKLTVDGVRCQQLTVSHAFHSPLMDAVLPEFEQICQQTSFSRPDRNMVNTVLGRVDTARISEADYWVAQIRRPVRFMDGIREMDQLGVDVFLEIGPKPILTALGQQCLKDRSQLWLPSLRAGHDDWTPMLQSLAELYLHGTEIDWDGFDRDYSRHKLPLPTYPFQRRRYWFAGENVPATDEKDKAAGRQAADMDQALYEIRWQPRSLLSHPPLRRTAQDLPDPQQIGHDIRADADRVRAQFELDRYALLDVEMDRLSVALVREAFQQLGWNPQVGEHIEWEAFVQRLGIVDDHRALCGRMLAMMAEEGWLASGDGWWKINQPLPPLTPSAQIAASLTARIPECQGEIALLMQCGTNLAGVLSGQVDSLQILFPDGSSEMVENLYSASPFARSLNVLVEESVARAVRDRPAGRSLKILEIGAGTGGTTGQILPRLPADRTEYVFTDVSEVFTHAAQQKFCEYPFVRYGALDVERDPSAQGYASEQFDVILAANVLHATRDLRQTLEHVRSLLVPGGMLVLLEGTRRQRWLDLIFGLTEGWWRFDDAELRPDYPLISASQWTSVLEESGFDSAAALPGNLQRDGATVEAPQSVVIARRSGQRATRTAATVRTKSPGTWLIFADQEGVGQQLAATLDDQQVPHVLLFQDKAFRQLSDDQFVLDPANVGDLQEVINILHGRNQSVARVVHLWSLDAANADDLSSDRLDRATHGGCGSALQMLQAIGRAGWSEQARMWFVTRGAQSVANDDSLPGIAQSPLWGLGRVVSEEIPAAWGALIDLDPQATIQQSAAAVLAEVEIASDEDQVALRGDQRYAARLVPRPPQNAPSDIQPARIRWRSDASYLISGGLGELGLRIADWIVRQGGRSLILFGRRPFPRRSQWDELARQDPRRAAQIEAIRNLEQMGARVRIASVDVADQIGLTSLFDQLEAEGLPPIRGVVHAAGVAEASALLELSSQELQDVLRPKVAGSWLLHRLLADARLDFFINFSSGAALLGSPLLGSYAAANSFLDALAHHRRALGIPALSVNWGFWDEVGMVARSQREIGRGFAPQGMQSFSPEQGLATLDKLLTQGATQTAVMPVDWSEWGRYHPRAVHAPLLRSVVQVDAEVSASDELAPVAGEFDRVAIVAAPPAERLEKVQQLIGRQLARVLRIPFDELDLDQPLNNLGIDSLMAVELRNHVQAQLGVVVPVAQLLQKDRKSVV